MNSTQIINLDQILANTLPQLALDENQVVPDFKTKVLPTCHQAFVNGLVYQVLVKKH